MNQIEQLRKLNNLSYFDKNTLSQVVDLADNSLYANIKRWLKKGYLIQLKRGLYVTKEYYSTANKDDYSLFVANTLRQPSYLSLEYILQKYSILSEAVFALTSVTLKTKQTYQNKLGTFAYRNISERLFTGFTFNPVGYFTIKEATKAKALFDYLYLKTLRVKNIDNSFMDSLRLNLDEFTKNEFSEFREYCKLAETKKLDNLISFIGEECGY